MQADQTNLFDLLPPPRPQEHKVDLVEVRRYLYGILEIARAADRMPWDPPQVRTKCNMMRQMPCWLPPEEAATLRADFAVEMHRLGIDRDACIDGYP